MKIIYSVVMACVLAGSASADLIFDQGVSTGIYGGAWANETTNQNFLDQVTLPSSAIVDRYTYYTYYDPSTFTGSLHLKLYADSAGTPGALLDAQDIPVSYYFSTATADAVSVYGVELDLGSSWFLNAGTTYWVGASGNGFDAAQVSLYTPGDGQMAQYFDTFYSFSASVGDQAFQLHGSAVPEPAPMIGLGLGALALLRRKKAR